MSEARWDGTCTTEGFSPKTVAHLRHPMADTVAVASTKSMTSIPGQLKGPCDPEGFAHAQPGVDPVHEAPDRPVALEAYVTLDALNDPGREIP